MFTTHTPRDSRLTPATSQLDRRQSRHLKENHLNPFFVWQQRGLWIYKGRPLPNSLISYAVPRLQNYHFLLCRCD